MPYEPPSAFGPGRENRVNPTSWTEAGAQYVAPNAQELAEQAAARAYRTPQQQEEEFYRQQVAGLQAMQQGADARFAAARAPQEAAAGVLGERAATLGGSAAMMAGQQAAEAAQARAMVAGRTPYGGKGTGPEAAILGGQLGQAAAAQMGGLEQEAAARQAAYLRSVASLGQGLMSEAEARRATEQELLRDMQTRFLAAQRLAGAQREQQAQENAAGLGRIGTVGGAIIGGLAGIPAGPAGIVKGAEAGAALGGKIG
jgi:hypothetical protein